MVLKRVNQQVVVIMGASSGIGRATAMKFASLGATVVVSARSQKGLNSLVDEIKRRGGVALAVPADVSNPEQVEHVAHRAVKEFGRIDTWVHLAAVSIYATFEKTKTVEFDRVVAVNLLGQVYGAQAALPHLRREGRGALIHVSSVEAMIAMPFQSAYAASKHGVVGFLDSLRLELARERVPISVTNIMPSGINTPFFDKALTRLGVQPRPTAPVYDPELVAAAIVRASHHPIRDLVVGGAGRILLLAQRISPLLTDALLETRIGFEGQMTTWPKAADAPHNLFRATDESHAKVEGDFSAEMKKHSASTQLAMSWGGRAAKRVVKGVFKVAARVFEAGWFLTLPRAARKNMHGKIGKQVP